MRVIFSYSIAPLDNLENLSIPNLCTICDRGFLLVPPQLDKRFLIPDEQPVLVALDPVGCSSLYVFLGKSALLSNRPPPDVLQVLKVNLVKSQLHHIHDRRFF